MSSSRVALGISGGKDSAAAALLLLREGLEVEAVTLRLGTPGEESRLEACEKLAATMGISLRMVDAREIFLERIIEPFLADYGSGITPNPCVACNARIKFDFLMDAAMATGAGWFATGHYARLEERERRIFLAKPKETSKSQTYFLSMVNPGRMEKVRFPLADISLETVRRLTRDLPLAQKRESQDICFLAGETLESYLRRHIPGAFRDGPLLNARGEKIGEHRGAAAVTIGQRRGLRYAAGRRLYVINRDMKRNAVILGAEKDLETIELKAGLPNYWRTVVPGEEVDVRIRYASPPTRGIIMRAGEKEIAARFISPVRAVTPGQVAVFSRDGLVAAAGIIR